MYNPPTKPANPYTAPWDSFKQPFYQWQPFRPTTTNKLGSSKRSLKRNYFNTLAGVMGSPYTRDQGFVNSQIADAKAAQLQGQQTAQNRLKQQAAQLGTTYTGMASDASREQDEALRQKLAAQTMGINREAVDKNRDDLLNILNMGGQDIYRRKQLGVMKTGQINQINAAQESQPQTGGGKVICSELHRQGLMPDDIYKADEEFGEILKQFNPVAMYGYQAWAIPCVRLMKKSKILSRIALIIATPWANQMAYLRDVREKPSFIGSLMLLFGLPICKMIGKIKLSKNKKEGINYV